MYESNLEVEMSPNRYKAQPIRPSEITPEHIYYSRRDFMKGFSVLSAGAFLAACSPGASNTPAPNGSAGVETAIELRDESGDPANTIEQITNYNNYYEFTTDKSGVASLAQDYQPRSSETATDWTVEVYGLVNKPQTFGMEDLLTKFTQEERIYRLRCVEGWSMVIPWTGFPLAALLQQVEPTSAAQYVRFETVFDPDQMPGQKSRMFPWPYQEGLRLDEAMNDLALLVAGLYGRELPAQNGMPLRLAVPWKYGFKSIKNIIKIELVDKEPGTLWSSVARNEYGFYANVNPEVDHPRWSQASERRIGESGRRPTLMFNGYAEDVAGLYEGMDLRVHY